MQRDRVLGVEQPDLGVEKADLAALALDVGLDRLAGEERAIEDWARIKDAFA